MLTASALLLAATATVCLHVRARSFATSEVFWQEVCKRSPSYHVAWNRVGMIHRDHGRMGDAATCFERAADLAPLVADYTNNLGITRAIQGDAAAAEKRFRRALEIDPDYPDPYANLGLLLLQQPPDLQPAPVVVRAMQPL